MKLSLSAHNVQFHVKETFIALRHRNYRLWFFGQMISLMGTWMQSTAQGYLIYELTRSPAYLGYVGFAAGLPAWMFTLYGGVIADRLPRRVLLIITQIYMMALAFVLAGLVFSGTVQAWHILVLATLLGVGNAFDAPARQAFVVELVDRESLTNAIALNSTMFNTATVVGPAVAGVTYALFGPAWCFTINGLSFLSVISALFFMRLTPAPTSRKQLSMSRQLKEGIQFVLSNSLVRILVVNMGMISLFGMSMMTLMPAWAVDVLGGDVRTNGMLLSSRGVGALVGALMVAYLANRPVRGKLWMAGSFLLPFMLMIFSQVRLLPVSLVVMSMVGWGFMIQANTSNSIVQTTVPDELRGRVMSIYTLIFFGGMPLGSLMVGKLATSVGEPATLLVNGLVLLSLAVLVFLFLPLVRQTR